MPVDKKKNLTEDAYYELLFRDPEHPDREVSEEKKEELKNMHDFFRNRRDFPYDYNRGEYEYIKLTIEELQK